MSLVLGIETSCDETAAAVVRSGEQVISNVVSSQFAVHKPYGGVVPELASREHLRNIVPVVRAAAEGAGAGRDLAAIDAIAVTQGPGLAGALLVGVSYAKALAFATEKPLIAVNHLEGHIHAVLLQMKQSGGGNLNFPVLALVVSGGHTHLYLASERENHWTYQNVGKTRDDAAGEAFDKVAKLLGLGYPGGPVIDRLSNHGDPHAVRFTFAHMKSPARGEKPPANEAEAGPRFDFSFSGIKTAVLRYVETHAMQAAVEERRHTLLEIAKPTLDDFLRVCDQQTLDLVASFQRAVIDDLAGKTLAAAEAYNVESLFITGGVAANSELRSSFEERGARAGLAVAFPSRPLSTDNAAMIAAAAYPKFLAGEFAPPDFSAEAGLVLR